MNLKKIKLISFTYISGKYPKKIICKACINDCKILTITFSKYVFHDTSTLTVKLDRYYNIFININI